MTWEKIRKTAHLFNKVYFLVEDEKFYIITTDRTNLFCQHRKSPVAEVPGVTDKTICFDLNNISGLMQIIEEEDKEYTMDIAWVPESDRGMIYVHTEDLTEKYFLFSREI